MEPWWRPPLFIKKKVNIPEFAEFQHNHRGYWRASSCKTWVSLGVMSWSGRSRLKDNGAMQSHLASIKNTARSGDHCKKTKEENLKQNGHGPHKKFPGPMYEHICTSTWHKGIIENLVVRQTSCSKCYWGWNETCQLCLDYRDVPPVITWSLFCIGVVVGLVTSFFALTIRQLFFW